MADSGNIMNQDLEQFLDRLMKEKFVEGSVTDEFVKESKDELRPLLLKKINLSLFEALSFTDREQFSHLVDTNATDSDLQQFFTDHIPHSIQIISQAMLSFRQAYIG